MFTRIIRRASLAALALGLLSSSASAQFAGPGLRAFSSSGPSAGSFAPGCTSGKLPLVSGEVITVDIWGDLGAPYLLLISGTTMPCQSFPGIGAGFLLAPPVIPLLAGTLTQTSPCLSCPSAFDELAVGIPAGIPQGTLVTMQALSYGAGHPSFTVGITIAIN